MKIGESMAEIQLKNKSVAFGKLENFGFRQAAENFLFEKKICDSQFLMEIKISSDGKIFTKITDNFSGEEYILHLVEGAAGSYVGAVRQEYEEVLKNFLETCCESNIFRGEITQEIIKFVREKYGDELEFLWERLPDAAIWRRKDSRKWYGALMNISERKLKLDSEKNVDILDLHGDPDEIKKIVDGEKFFPGWHMNKKSWFTVRLDGSVSVEEICELLEKSYTLAAK